MEAEVSCETRANRIETVDGGGWRTSSANPGSEFPYPEFLLKDDVVQGVKGMKAQAKAKL